MKYRKKPIIIDAIQWFPGILIDCVITKEVAWDYQTDCDPYINTLEGRMNVSPGDYIITGVKGEKYPCKADIFELSYEKVEE